MKAAKLPDYRQLAITCPRWKSVYVCNNQKFKT